MTAAAETPTLPPAWTDALGKRQLDLAAAWPFDPAARLPIRHRIVVDLWPLAVPVDTLAPLPYNPHKGDVAAMRRSLATYGQRKPVVVNVASDSPVIEAGNTTQAAAIAERWTHLAIVRVRDDPTTETGYAIADNRIAQLGTFDLRLLADATSRLQAVSPETLLAAGYTADAHDDLLAAAGAVHTPPPEPFQGGYAETAEQEAERRARGEAARTGDEAPPVLREILLRYTPDAYDEVVPPLRAAMSRRGLTTLSATVAALALEDEARAVGGQP